MNRKLEKYNSLKYNISGLENKYKKYALYLLRVVFVFIIVSLFVGTKWATELGFYTLSLVLFDIFVEEVLMD